MFSFSTVFMNIFEWHGTHSCHSRLTNKQTLLAPTCYRALMAFHILSESPWRKSKLTTFIPTPDIQVTSIWRLDTELFSLIIMQTACNNSVASIMPCMKVTCRWCTQSASLLQPRGPWASPRGPPQLGAPPRRWGLRDPADRDCGGVKNVNTHLACRAQTALCLFALPAQSPGVHGSRGAEQQGMLAT